ncbi:hypothetical protein [Lentibacillus salicampi]|uniref:Uncharacterized protein n=1 Tax=Lentibacillus salicampi TaxID=175306 RepID=A0A4Y9A682_9BACI|nr:hypothetical protein [Lentibacillus salicampi]TFJ90248.1 hypothetical protein E4U82_19340 [Lentibacillus salicampi]
MTSPHERINDSIEETKSVIGEAKKQLTKIGIPSYVQSLQISSFEQRLQDLAEEKKDVTQLSQIKNRL